jgi:regulator of sigma E protease
MLGVNIFYFVLILMALVFIHELGHMVVAKWCGMRVERFSIFFGRPIASFRRGETEYAFGWLPLGGYVKISGMVRGEEIPPEHEHRAYYNAATWKRVATIFAGPAVNIVLALVLFVVTFWVGVPVVKEYRVGAVQPDTPAAVVGLERGDRIVAVNGVRSEPDDTTPLRDELQANPGEPVRVTWLRDGREITRTSPPLLRGEVEDREVGQLGVAFAAVVEIRQYGPVEGIVEGADFTWFVIAENFRVMGQIFTDEEAREQISGPVGIGAIFNEVSGEGLVTILRFTALISLALGLFNLLPLMPLDGGHILFALIEKVKGGSLSQAVYARASFVGLALILFVAVFALQNDILRITGEGFMVER